MNLNQNHHSAGSGPAFSWTTQRFNHSGPGTEGAAVGSGGSPNRETTVNYTAAAAARSVSSSVVVSTTLSQARLEHASSVPVRSYSWLKAG